MCSVFKMIRLKRQALKSYSPTCFSAGRTWWTVWIIHWDGARLLLSSQCRYLLQFISLLHTPITVRNIGRVGYDSAESDTTRPSRIRLGHLRYDSEARVARRSPSRPGSGPTRTRLGQLGRVVHDSAELTESGPSRTRSGSTRRSSVDSALRVIPEGAESDTTRPSFRSLV